MGIDLYHHATILHGPGCRKARTASAEFAKANCETTDSVSAASAHRSIEDPALERRGRGSSPQGAEGGAWKGETMRTQRGQIFGVEKTGMADGDVSNTSE